MLAVALFSTSAAACDCTGADTVVDTVLCPVAAAASVGVSFDAVVAPVPVPEDFSGKLHYKSMLGTRSGTFPFSYPAPGAYEEVNIAYRAPYGNAILAFMLFCLVAGTVWGSLGLAIKKMNESGEEEASIVGALD